MKSINMRSVYKDYPQLRDKLMTKALEISSLPGAEVLVMVGQESTFHLFKSENWSTPITVPVSTP